MNVIKEFQKATLVNGATQTVSLTTYSGAKTAILYIMKGIGLGGTAVTSGTPDVQKAPYGEGIALHGNNGGRFEFDIGGAANLYIREFSNGGRGTNIPGLQNEFVYKLVLTD